MSTDEDDESESWFRRRFAEAVSFYGKILQNFWAIAKEPRQAWKKLKKSRLASNFVFGLFVSELAGLAIVLVLTVVFILLGYGTHMVVLTAIGIAHYLLDAPFDFWLWPCSCKALYPKKRWKAMYAADMGYFCLAGKAIDWLSLAFQGGVSTALIAYCGFSELSAVFVAKSAQIPLYIILYTFLSVPLLLIREEELATFVSKSKMLADRFLNWQSALPLFGAKYLWCRKIWIRRYCIQPRAGPMTLKKNFTPTKSVGLFFKTERGIFIFSAPNPAIAENCVEL